MKKIMKISLCWKKNCCCDVGHLCVHCRPRDIGATSSYNTPELWGSLNPTELPNQIEKNSLTFLRTKLFWLQTTPPPNPYSPYLTLCVHRWLLKMIILIAHHTYLGACLICEWLWEVWVSVSAHTHVLLKKLCESLGFWQLHCSFQKCRCYLSIRKENIYFKPQAFSALQK